MRSLVYSGGRPFIFTSQLNFLAQYQSRAAMMAEILDCEPPEVMHPSPLSTGNPYSASRPWIMLSSSSVAAGPWSQLSMLSLKHAMMSSEQMVSVSTGECRCGMYLVDHVRSRWGRISFSVSSSTFSNPFPCSGRNPSALIFSLSS